MSDWNAQIIEEFRTNEGRVGGRYEGAPMILIHHVGARTGTKRVTPLVWLPHADGSMVIVASKSGAPTHPHWYHNLKANPVIDVEVGTETFSVTAEEIDSPERDEIWARLVTIMPNFAEYQEKTTRKIPLLRLTRQG